MACASQVVVLVPRSCVNVDAHAGEGIRQGLGGHPNSIGERCDFVKLRQFL